MPVVMIPAYQPDETLVSLTDQLWEYGCRIVVVDDGSGETYQPVFDKIRDICVILRHSENRGKGAAIKTALTYVKKELWEETVIGIMDCDGQHLPEDMMKLLAFAGTHRKTMVLGVRKVGKEMPLRSRLGNQITRTVFRLVSGVKVTDTQTGLRAFDSELSDQLLLIEGERYEYEMNVLIALAKAGIPVEEVPIHTIYRDKRNSTSHFRTIQDSIRIYKTIFKCKGGVKKRILWLALDVAAAALILLGVWGMDYRIPQKGIHAVPMQETTVERTAFLQKTNVTTDVEDWHEKFADKFTDQVISTDTSYTSPNVSVQLSYHQVDTGKLDTSNEGKHEKYGTKISYVLADIYVGDITCFQTAFAKDTYGVGYSEKLTDMSARMKSILAVNGDSYSNNRHEKNGTIIRNGVIYRNKQTTEETCVLNWDGTMDIYQPGQADYRQLVDRGAYQSWIFGPSLLDENGKAKDAFLTWDYIRQSHPRTAIGYYEPGHYCLLLVDGRQKNSRGMFLDEMAKVFEDLGCKKAYNLDGGHCSFMTLQDQVANHPYKPEHEVEDGIFITEGLPQAG